LVNLVTYSPDETRSLGHLIGSCLPNPSILGLDGSLGAGKTCLVQGIARGLGISLNTQVISPAYTLVQEYPITQHSLIHIDFYRLETLNSIDRMLFEEIFENSSHIIVAEWASKFLSELATDFLQISICPGSDQNHRNFRISSDSGIYTQVLRQISGYANTGT